MAAEASTTSVDGEDHGIHRGRPVPDAQRTGRAFITPCCIAGSREFLVDGVLWLAFHVAGHGWEKPWRDRIKDIHDTGKMVEADGTERRVYWRTGRDA